MKKKLVATIGIFSVLLIAVVCLLPWPTRINVEMYGMVTMESGEAVHEVQFAVSGWKLNYLFRRDKLNVDITFIPDGTEPFLMYAETSGRLDSFSPSYYLTAYMAYQTNQHQLVSGYFGLSTDLDCCILTGISDEDHCIIGSVTPDFDLDSILAMFDFY